MFACSVGVEIYIFYDLDIFSSVFCLIVISVILLDSMISVDIVSVDIYFFLLF